MNRYAFKSTWVKPNHKFYVPVAKGQMWISWDEYRLRYLVVSGNNFGSDINPSFKWHLVSQEGPYSEDEQWLTEEEIREGFTFHE